MEIECVDRLYLNAYVPGLQVGAQVNRFLEAHLGNRIGSPAIIEKIGNGFRRDVKAFAARHHVPILALNKPDRTRWDDRKLDRVRPYLDRAEAAGRAGVVAIVAAQEFQWVYSAAKRTGSGGGVYFAWVKEERRVGVFYFYVFDREFGPGPFARRRARVAPALRGNSRGPLSRRPHLQLGRRAPHAKRGRAATAAPAAGRERGDARGARPRGRRSRERAHPDARERPHAHRNRG